jgi:hypothetical protein
MRILSIDVGERNLAWCELETDTLAIRAWQNVDLSTGAANERGDIKFVQCDECKGKATHCMGEVALCRKHVKVRPEVCTTSVKELRPAGLKKLTKGQLVAVGEQHCPLEEGERSLLKAEWLARVTAYVREQCFVPLGARLKVAEEEQGGEPKVVRAARVLKDVVAAYVARGSLVEHVLIENQLGHVATGNIKMQCMLAQCFVDLLPGATVHFVNATNKLRASTGAVEAGGTASQRKRKRKEQAVADCRERLTCSVNEGWGSFFAQSKKKDDLADSFLQGVWFSLR